MRFETTHGTIEEAGDDLVVEAAGDDGNAQTVGVRISFERARHQWRGLYRSATTPDGPSRLSFPITGTAWVVEWWEGWSAMENPPSMRRRVAQLRGIPRRVSPLPGFRRLGMTAWHGRLWL